MPHNTLDTFTTKHNIIASALNVTAIVSVKGILEEKMKGLLIREATDLCKSLVAGIVVAQAL